MKKIAVCCSGSDAPGMNACIRAIVRAAHCYNIETIGVIAGFNGMINGNFILLDNLSVSNIIQSGGTILKCGLSEEFKTKEGRKKAYLNLDKHEVDGLIVIGGDGTFAGAELIHHETGIPCIGIPGTLDNDLYGTDFTIGYDTAVNTALAAIDQLRDTADSHERIFFVEVMGKDMGMSLASAIAGGAEMVISSEETSVESIVQKFEKVIEKSKGPHIIIVTDDKSGKAQLICQKIKSTFPELDTKVTSIGYVQRGGEPSAADRVLASQLGIGAIEGLLGDKKKHMVGTINGELVYTPFSESAKKTKSDNDALTILFEAMGG